MKLPESVVEFDAIDLAFGEFAVRYGGFVEQPELEFAARCVSAALRGGETSLPLRRLSEWDEHSGSTGTAWREILTNPELNRTITVLPSGVIPAAVPNTPLILAGERLWLQRFFRYEVSVARRLRDLAAAPAEPPAELTPLDELMADFGNLRNAAGVNSQKLAVYNTLCRRFAVISGGPGTGKTTVAAAVLALELERRPGLRIAAGAFTGKGADQLAAALAVNAERLRLAPRIKEALTAVRPMTLHRLLEADVDGNFRRNADRRLDCDLLLVDEYSMVSLALTARLLAALPPTAKLIWLGDHHQLNAIDPGRVLAEVCQASGIAPSPETAAAFGLPPPAQSASPLAGCTAILDVNYRSCQAPNLCRFADRLRIPGNSGELAAELEQADYPDLKAVPPPNRPESELKLRLSRLAALPDLARNGSANALCTAFELVNSFKILCAVNSGFHGVDNLNAMALKLLGFSSPTAPGVPFILTASDAGQQLYNGDCGLWWRTAGGTAIACFPDGRSCSAADLPEFRPAFAMTVHKAQGSGYPEVLVVFPEYDLPRAGRELLYTAITRAELRAEVWITPGQLRRVLSAEITECSGLADLLN